MTMLRAFSLLEILVALLIGASLMSVAGSLFGHVLDYRQHSDTTRAAIAQDIALQLLAADIDNSIAGLPPRPAIEITQTTQGGHRIALKKNTYAQGIVNIAIRDIVWTIEPDRITRSVTGGTNPMIIATGAFRSEITPIKTQAYHLKLHTQTGIKSVILWRKGGNL